MFTDVILNDSDPKLFEDEADEQLEADKSRKVYGSMKKFPTKSSAEKKYLFSCFATFKRLWYVILNFVISSYTLISPIDLTWLLVMRKQMIQSILLFMYTRHHDFNLTFCFWLFSMAILFLSALMMDQLMLQRRKGNVGNCRLMWR